MDWSPPVCGSTSARPVRAYPAGMFARYKANHKANPVGIRLRPATRSILREVLAFSRADAAGRFTIDDVIFSALMRSHSDLCARLRSRGIDPERILRPNLPPHRGPIVSGPPDDFPMGSPDDW